MSLQPTFRRAIFAVTILVTLYFGWRPFSFNIKNDVRLDPKNGAIRFNERHEDGDHIARGIVYCDQELDTQAWDGITIVTEIRGRWNGHGLSVFFDFFDSNADELSPALFAQWKEHLALRSKRSREEVERGYSEIGYQGLFAGNDFVNLVFASQGSRTLVFVNGKMVEARSDFPLLGPDNKFVGSLAIGNSANGKSPFKGEIRRMAIYNGYYRPNSTEMRLARPVWSFDVSKSQMELDGMPVVKGLKIDSRFKPANLIFLKPIQEIHLDRPEFRSDFIINAIGFLPAGICFTAVARRRFKSFILVAVFVTLASFSLSMMIEVGQGYIVQRYSSQLDVALNTVSGLLGVLIPRRWVLFL